MTNIPKLKAKELIQRQADSIPTLKTLPQGRDSRQFRSWEIFTTRVISRVFGEQSPYFERFQQIYFYPVSYVPSESEIIRRQKDYQAFVEGLTHASAILDSMLNEIEELWPNDDVSIADMQENKSATPKTRIFVVHGRDIGTREQVVRFLEQLKLDTIVLQEQPDRGQTVIEKFEAYADDTRFAVVVCTPDDVGRLDGDQNGSERRARQNVIFELGYFVGKLGRGNVSLIVKGNVDFPSDYYGVLHTKLDKTDGWKTNLLRELKDAGFSIDANRVFDD